MLVEVPAIIEPSGSIAKDVNVPVTAEKELSSKPVLATKRLIPYAPAATTYSTPPTFCIRNSSDAPPSGVVAEAVAFATVESNLSRSFPTVA